MNTPTHLLISTALLARPGHRPRNWAAVAGAILPDTYLFSLYLFSKLKGVSEQEIWGRIFWEPSVQFFAGLSHSVPLFLVLLGAGLLLRGRQALISVILIVLSLSGLLHALIDFLFHHDDAYRHFWPLTDWRFLSPLSYWDPAYYGKWVGLFEAGLSLVLIGVLWLRFKSRAMRSLLLLGVLSAIAIPLHILHGF